jgi:serine protease inhibitor
MPHPTAPPKQHAYFSLKVSRLLLAAAGPGNLVWSPYSVLAALRLTAAGARGHTRAELTATIGDLDELTGLLARAESAGTGDSAAKIAAAYALWVDTTLPVEDAYAQIVNATATGAAGTGQAGGGVRAVDFRGDPAAARQVINADVEEHTRGWIRELLSAEHVTRATRAILVNALWARLRWIDPFDPARTAPADFHAPGGVRQVPTMARTGLFSYAAADNWQLVTLPSHGDLVLDVLLRDRPAGNADADKAGTAGNGPPRGMDTHLSPGWPDPTLLAMLYRQTGLSMVDLRLPRFAVAYGTELAPVLTRLGARSLFTPEADLSGISPEPLMIDKVVHRAVLNVDEEGAEGAAATAVLAVPGGPPQKPPPPIEMHVDRPFLAVVRHASTGVILFAAWVAEP